MKSQMVKTVLLSAAGGAILWWIVLGVGFGWMPAGSAESKATERVDAALLDALAFSAAVGRSVDRGDTQMRCQELAFGSAPFRSKLGFPIQSG